MENKRLPHITAFPKFHKIKLSERFVISYASCLIKPLSRSICLALKSIYSCIVNYCYMLNTVTGINHNWMIQNNFKIVDCLEHINSNGLARNIQTYDFSTFQTTFVPGFAVYTHSYSFNTDICLHIHSAECTVRLLNQAGRRY